MHGRSELGGGGDKPAADVWYRHQAGLPPAEQAVAIARKIAFQRQKAIAESDDLLAGLCALGAGSAFEVLNRCGVKPAVILAHFGVSDGWQKLVAPTNFPYHDSAKITLALAMRESKSMRAGCVGTDHMLIAMLNPKTGNVSDYFRDHGISCREIEAKLAEMKNEKKEPSQ